MLTKDAVGIIRSSRTFAGAFNDEMKEEGGWCVIQ
jgi:hypothetical protein